MEEVTVVTVSITENLEVIKQILSDDPKLAQVTLQVKDEFERGGIEVFSVDRNLIISEEGYNIVCFNNANPILN